MHHYPSFVAEVAVCPYHCRNRFGLLPSFPASFRPLFRKYQPDEHRICYLVCARAETLELPLGELRPGKNIYTAAEWLPTDQWRMCTQWDFRLKAAVEEYMITAENIDLAAVFAQPALAHGTEIPEHFGRQLGRRAFDVAPKPLQPPPGFGPDWWRKQVCSQSQPVPDYPAAEIRDVLNTAAAGRWAGLGDPMLELMVRRRLAQHAADGATCATCANQRELLVLPNMIEGSKKECLYCQADQFVRNSSLAKVADNWLVPAFGHNNDRTGAWQASSSTKAPNDHKKGTAVEAMLGVVGLKAGLEIAASLYADKVTGLPDWHAAEAPQQIDPPVELRLPWILDQAVGPAASLLTAGSSRWARLHFLGEAATSLCLMRHHFVTHPGADKGRLHELHKNNKGVGTIEKVSLARAAKEAGLDTWLDDACTKSGLEMCVRVNAEKGNKSEGFAETCIAAECWCVAVGWLLEQYGGRPDPRNYDVAGFVCKFVLHLSETEIEDDWGRQPAGRVEIEDGGVQRPVINSDGGTESAPAPSTAEAAAPDDWGQPAGRAEHTDEEDGWGVWRSVNESGIGDDWGARRPVSNSDWDTVPAPAPTAAELAATDEHMLNMIQKQVEYYVSDVSLDQAEDSTAQELEVSYNTILAAESMVPGTQPEDPEPRRLHNGQLLLEDGQPMDAYSFANHEARAKMCTIPIALLAGYPKLAILLADMKELRKNSRPGVPPGSDEGIVGEAVALSRRVKVVQPGRLRRKQPYDPIEGRKRREQTESIAAVVRAHRDFGNKRWVVMHLKNARTKLAAYQAELEALPTDNALACERLLRIDKQLNLLVFGGCTESNGAHRGGTVVVGADGGSGKLRGIAVRWTDRGFGFISPDDGSPEIFCHCNEIVDGNCLREGSHVEYEKSFDKRRGKNHATNVTGGSQEGHQVVGITPQEMFRNAHRHQDRVHATPWLALCYRCGMQGHKERDCPAAIGCAVVCCVCKKHGHTGNECPERTITTENDHYFLLFFDAKLLQAVVALEYAKRSGITIARPEGPTRELGSEPPFVATVRRVQEDLLDEGTDGICEKKFEFQHRSLWRPWFAAIEAVAELLLAEADLGRGKLASARTKANRAEESWAAVPTALRAEAARTVDAAVLEDDHHQCIVCGCVMAYSAFSRSQLSRIDGPKCPDCIGLQREHEIAVAGCRPLLYVPQRLWPTAAVLKALRARIHKLEVKEGQLASKGLKKGFFG